ncbi:MAG: VIT1/CCC1 transporter family protein, partial [Bacteroidales bacterium]
MRNKHNRDILLKIAEEEMKHYDVWKKYTKQEISPSRWGVFCGVCSTYILGTAFTLRSMEKLADRQFFPKKMELLKQDIPEVELIIIKDEHDHEEQILLLLDQSYIKFIGSIVLGLNDALVEMLGCLAGFSLAYQNSKLIALTGLITGSAASMSMAASEYLSLKAEQRPDALRASIFTGLTYISVVVLLILPYILIPHQVYVSLGVVILTVLIIIFFFNYYIATVQGTNFWPHFREMAIISLSVALISFIIGHVSKVLFNIEI